MMIPQYDISLSYWGIFNIIKLQCFLLINQCSDSCYFFEFTSGRKYVNMPNNGKKAVSANTCWMPLTSAIHPNNAEPMPPSPKERPKKAPLIIPTLPGNNSVAYTKMADIDEVIIRPITTHKTMVQNKLQ